LSAGFSPDYTGRENVFLKASLLGLSRKETNAKFDQIAAFADIGDFLEEPVRTYSSGMMVRLAFAVSVNVEPDVLIIDEALAVGDARFQLKCAKAIGRFRDNGVSLLFVSHSMSSVKQLCNYGMLIEGGKSIYFGKPNDVSNLYSRLIADGGTVESLEQDIKNLNSGESSKNEGEIESKPKQSSEIPIDFNMDSDLRRLRLKVSALERVLNDRPDSKELLSRVEALLAEEKTERQGSGEEYSYGGKMGLIREIGILDDKGAPRTWFDSGEYVLVYMNVESKENFPEPIFAFTLKDKAGVEVYGTNTFFSGQEAFPIGIGEKRRVEFRFPLNIMAGHYFISFGFTHFLGNDLTVIHRRYDAIKIDIHAKDKSFGQVNLWAEIKQSSL
jgi:ABC-type multidrug transport system ATPase subunit